MIASFYYQQSSFVSFSGALLSLEYVSFNQCHLMASPLPAAPQAYAELEAETARVAGAAWAHALEAAAARRAAKQRRPAQPASVAKVGSGTDAPWRRDIVRELRGANRLAPLNPITILLNARRFPACRGL